MTAAAVMLVKDEADVIEPVLRHLLAQLDHVLVADNLSTDGTRAILDALEREHRGRLSVETDEELAYYQSAKTSALAARALALGHSWVIPCDADEVWYSPDGRRLADYLAGIPPDVQFVLAELFNHIPSGHDPPASCDTCSNVGRITASFRRADGGIGTREDTCPTCQGKVQPNPLIRIGWRQREKAPQPKISCRLREGLEIGMGNHSAWAPGVGLPVVGLVVRHFTWRSVVQYQAKIRSGSAAYAATAGLECYGGHWRLFDHIPPEERDAHVEEHFKTWFWRADPTVDDSLIYDPAPVSG